MTEKELIAAVRGILAGRGLMRSVAGDDDSRPTTCPGVASCILSGMVPDTIRGRVRRAKALIGLAERLAAGETVTGYNSLVTYRVI